LQESTSQRGTNPELPVPEGILQNLELISKNDVTVVLPVLNEEAGVEPVIDEILANGYRNILVVDGYSTDNTVQVAKEKEVSVVRQHGRGKTGAIRTAIECVSTPYFLVMDGDHTYDAADIEKFLQHGARYDEIIGARRLENISPLHRVGNKVICRLFNTMFGTTFQDVCSGMYLLKTKSARRLDFRTKGFSVEVEILAQAAVESGESVTEVPINYRERIGKPKLSTWSAGIDILRSIMLLARQYNPVFLFSILAGSAAIPGAALILWVVWVWLTHGGFHSGYALMGAMLLLLASQAFFIGTIAVLFKRAELRIERLLRSEGRG